MSARSGFPVYLLCEPKSKFCALRLQLPGVRSQEEAEEQRRVWDPVVLRVPLKACLIIPNQFELRDI